MDGYEVETVIAVSYGAGTNSTAMLIGMRERDIVPDVITFADTGGELPETYTHLDFMQEWCKEKGFPEIVIVQKTDKYKNAQTLEGRCVSQNMLPSIAYGFKACSLRHKVQPQEKYLNNYAPAKAVWKKGEKITKYIGYDADEERRAKIESDNKYNYEFPLIVWGWGREECIEAIDRAGIPRPGKSACFFCPSSKQSEIRKLAVTHPDLMERALAMEAGAELTTIKGLGRNFAWRDVIATDEMFPESYIDEPCGCYDG